VVSIYNLSMVCIFIEHCFVMLIRLLAGNYEQAVEASNSAAAITAVLYPNDNTTCVCIRYFFNITANFSSVGKELRLKQQYFWTAASLGTVYILHSRRLLMGQQLIFSVASRSWTSHSRSSLNVNNPLSSIFLNSFSIFRCCHST
jgi:glucan phosphorylase